MYLGNHYNVLNFSENILMYANPELDLDMINACNKVLKLEGCMKDIKIRI